MNFFLKYTETDKKKNKTTAMLSTLGASDRQGDVDEAKNEWTNATLKTTKKSTTILLLLLSLLLLQWLFFFLENGTIFFCLLVFLFVHLFFFCWKIWFDEIVRERERMEREWNREKESAHISSHIAALNLLTSNKTFDGWHSETWWLLCAFKKIKQIPKNEQKQKQRKKNTIRKWGINCNVELVVGFATYNSCVFFFSWINFYYHNIHNYSCCFLWLYYFNKKIFVLFL